MLVVRLAGCGPVDPCSNQGRATIFFTYFKITFYCMIYTNIFFNREGKNT